jgi:hypothetical protein
MLVKVNLPNGSFLILEELEASRLFSELDDVDIVPFEEYDKTPKEIRLHNNSFSSLVGSIDAKWNWDYISYEEDNKEDTIDEH